MLDQAPCCSPWSQFKVMHMFKLLPVGNMPAHWCRLGAEAQPLLSAGGPEIRGKQAAAQAQEAQYLKRSMILVQVMRLYIWQQEGSTRVACEPPALCGAGEMMAADSWGLPGGARGLQFFNI